MNKLIIPENLNEWFGSLCKPDKEDIYKYWVRQDNFIFVEPPGFVEPIEYFKHLPKSTTTCGRG